MRIKVLELVYAITRRSATTCLIAAIECHSVSLRYMQYAKCMLRICVLASLGYVMMHSGSIFDSCGIAVNFPSRRVTASLANMCNLLLPRKMRLATSRGPKSLPFYSTLSAAIHMDARISSEGISARIDTDVGHPWISVSPRSSYLRSLRNVTVTFYRPPQFHVAMRRDAEKPRAWWTSSLPPGRSVWIGAATEGILCSVQVHALNDRKKSLANTQFWKLRCSPCALWFPWALP